MIGYHRGPSTQCPLEQSVFIIQIDNDIFVKRIFEMSATRGTIQL